MKLSILIPTSALVVAMGLAMPVAAQAQQPGPAQKAIQRALGRHPKVLKELKALTPAQKQALRDEVRALLQQARPQLQAQHTPGQKLRGQLKLRAEIRKAIRKALGKGGSV